MRIPIDDLKPLYFLEPRNFVVWIKYYSFNLETPQFIEMLD